jgi:hypothetical protein
MSVKARGKKSYERDGKYIIYTKNSSYLYWAVRVGSN